MWVACDITQTSLQLISSKMEQPEALVAKNEVSRTVVMGEGEEQTGEEGPSVMKALPQDKVDLWSIFAF